MSSIHVRIFEGGKIVIPAAFRRRHGFGVGATLVVEERPEGLMIRSLDDAVADAQAIMAKVAPAERCLSDELVADRKAEAARE